MGKPSRKEVMILNLSVMEVCLMKLIMEIYSVAKAILRTVFVSKVSPITMKTQSGDSVIMMMPATVRVSPMKLIMEIHSRMKMILTTLFVLKVSRMTM